jgi:hypothetical protein
MPDPVFNRLPCRRHCVSVVGSTVNLVHQASIVI